MDGPLLRSRIDSIAGCSLGRGERISCGPSPTPGKAKGHPKVVLPEFTSGRWLQRPPPEGRTRCLSRHTTSARRWPPAPSTRSIDATTTTQMTRPAIPTSSRSSTSADEPSRSATTVTETPASFPSATPTDWPWPTARKRTGRRSKFRRTQRGNLNGRGEGPLRCPFAGSTAPLGRPGCPGPQVRSS